MSKYNDEEKVTTTRAAADSIAKIEFDRKNIEIVNTQIRETILQIEQFLKALQEYNGLLRACDTHKQLIRFHTTTNFSRLQNPDNFQVLHLVPTKV